MQQNESRSRRVVTARID